jgi:tubulin---tyrosine ligase
MQIVSTEKFSVIEISNKTVVDTPANRAITGSNQTQQQNLPALQHFGVFLDVDEPYTRLLIQKAFQHPSRAPYFRITLGPGKGWESVPLPPHCNFQWSEYERVDWYNGVLLGYHGASSYCIRKGLSRKAQLAHFTRLHVCKYPDSILRGAIPQTVILDCWSVWDEVDNSTMNNNGTPSMTHQNGFADVVVNIGSTSKSGDCSANNRRERLDKCLSEAKKVMDAAEFEYQLGGSNDDESAAPVWILKGSTTNKGVGIYIVHLYEQVLDHCWAEPTIREWYVSKIGSVPESRLHFVFLR